MPTYLSQWTIGGHEDIVPHWCLVTVPTQVHVIILVKKMIGWYSGVHMALTFSL